VGSPLQLQAGDVTYQSRESALVMADNIWLLSIEWTGNKLPVSKAGYTFIFS